MAEVDALELVGPSPEGVVGATLPQAVRVRVVDRNRCPVAPVFVTWTVAVGSGLVDQRRSETTSDGVASTTWTLGTTAGQQRLTAAVDGAAISKEIIARAVPGSVVAIDAVEGDDQTGPPNAPLGDSLLIRSVDQYSNRAGTVVVWEISGGGDIQPNPTTTDSATGEARVQWTLGSGGLQEARATVEGAAPAVFTAALEGAPPGNNGLPGRITFASDRDGDWEIFVVDASDPMSVTQVTHNSVDDRHPSWGPGYAEIVYESQNSLLRISSSGGQPTAIVGVGGNASPDWSRAVNRIAYHESDDIFTIAPNGTAKDTTRFKNGVVEIEPAWSPDGTMMALARDRDANNTNTDFEIWTWSADGSGADPKTHNTVQDRDPAWSPDGRSLAFQRNQNGTRDIIIFDLQSRSERNLTNASSQDRDPTWSPDGKYIAFRSNRAGTDDIWVMRADGTGTAIRITNGVGASIEPDWSN